MESIILLVFKILCVLKNEGPLSQKKIGEKDTICNFFKEIEKKIDRKIEHNNFFLSSILKILESEGKVEDLNKNKSKNNRTKWQITDKGKKALKSSS